MKRLATTFERCENIGLYQDDDQNFYLKGDSVLYTEEDSDFWDLVNGWFPAQKHLQNQKSINKPAPKSFIPSEIFEYAEAVNQ